jgi:hypothetical protein
MNFGKWILLSFIVFATFIGVLVTVCIRQDIDLVSKDYYKDELAYQDQILRIQNTRDLKERPSIQRINDKSLQIKFDISAKVQKATLIFFCPSNPKMDQLFNLNLSDANAQEINIESFKKGMYRARLSWTTDSKEFFYEEEIFL